MSDTAEDLPTDWRSGERRSEGSAASSAGAAEPARPVGGAQEDWRSGERRSEGSAASSAGAAEPARPVGGAQETQSWGGWDAARRDDPFTHFAEVQARGPVHQVRLADGHEAWLVVGHDEARRALNDARISKDMLSALAADDDDVVAEGLPGRAFSRHMLNVDPPDHTRLRALVAPAFLSSRIAALEPSIRRVADELLDALAATGPGAVVDLVDGFARPFPFVVICELLGIPSDDRARLARWFRTLLSPWEGDPSPATVAASDGIIGYLGELVAAKRRRPGDDLVTVLLAGSDGDSLSEQELLSSLFQLIVAGHDTTTSLIGNGIVALLDHPDQWRLLRDDPGRIADAVEELVRFSAPVPHATFRMTTEATDLDSVEIPARRQVLVCLAAANRDPQVFAAADRLDVGRPRRAHLGFGHGIHFCLGAPLARLEARLAFTTVLARFPDLRLAVPRRELAWRHGDGLVLRGLDALPVVLAPTSATGRRPGTDPHPHRGTTPQQGATTMTTTDAPTADNGVDVAALLAAREALTAAPQAALFTWRARCEWVAGTHARTTVEDFSGLGGEQSHRSAFHLHTDHPEIFASRDEGMTPVEAVLGGLDGCLTAGVAAVATNRGVQLHSVTATLQGEMDIQGILGMDPDVRPGFGGITVTYDIAADASRADIEAIVVQAQKRSAVYDVITNPTNVVVTVA